MPRFWPVRDTFLWNRGFISSYKDKVRRKVETKMKKEGLVRKPIGFLLSELGMLLFAAAAIPVCAQMSPETIRKLQQMQQAGLERAHERYMYGSGRNQRGEAPELNNFFGRDMSPDTGVPGARLAQEAYVDIYAHNYNGAIPLLQKAVRLGNEDAMLYLSYCNFYGFGVPVDRGKALQLQQTVGIASARRVARIDREQQEERARAAREFERRIENAASSSTYRSTPSKPYKPEPMIVLTPWGPRVNAPFTSGGLWYHLNNP
jgi:hypothetical protein